MVPTRNSSVIGASSGSKSLGLLGRRHVGRADRCAGRTSSSTWSRCSASTETCCFSQATRGDAVALAGLQEERPLPRLADGAGHEAVRGVVAVDENRHDAQPSAATHADVGSCRSPDRRRPGRRRRSIEPAGERLLAGLRGGNMRRQVAARGVHGHHVRAGRGVADHRHRRGVDQDPLEGVEVHAERVGQDRLDHVTVGDRHPDRVRRRARPTPCRPRTGSRRRRGRPSRSSTRHRGTGPPTAAAARSSRASPCSAP